MGRAGRDMVVREYSVSKIAGATLALYRELLDLRGDGRQAQALA
jgi:glycosyltransferase involved in cell wall biosynthesis